MMQTALEMTAQKHLQNLCNIAHLLNAYRKLCFPNSMIFHTNVKIVIWIPESSRGAPGDPAESPVGPVDDLQMAAVNEKSVRNHAFCNIDVKFVSKACKTKNLKNCGRFPYISCVF